MILFLDFDGVLHPIPAAEGYLSCLGRLEEVLREFEGVRVVISSSWREVYPWEVLLEMFSEDIRPRILGRTPSLKYDESAPHWRWAEICAYLEETGYRGPWLALDDARNEFPDGCPQLLACDEERAFDEEAAERLRRWLEVHQ